MSIGSTVHWDIQISHKADQSLRSFFEDQGMDASKQSEFVEKAMLARIFHQTVAEIHTQNRNVDQDQLQTEIDAAVREVRQDKRRELNAAKAVDSQR